MNAKVKETEKKLESTDKRRITWGLNSSLILAISTPFFYLNGKAFHDGYLSYFKLAPSMFPLDTSATFVTAVMAWLYAMNNGLGSILGIIGQHWQRTLLIGLGLILTLAAFNYLIKWLGHKIDEKSSHSPQRQPNTQALSFLKELERSALYVFIPSYGLLLIMLIISVILITTLKPFVLLGKETAAEDLKNGFKDSPQVTVNDPDGHKGTYRVMQCSASFCALYADGKAITVPIATLNWVVSDVAEKLKAQPGN
ncbi:hypothetical protein [Pseudomonas sp. WS 5414]|uniref:hypothetical protein n=1 Tax=Pseudomonas TaxID=286 RepID=UPI0014756016|nr:hypothetical protein [Pseudomonas sp. WS 5414]NMY71234.1 hypothetical protein [Pseudomonas sp. WS 5414]